MKKAAALGFGAIYTRPEFGGTGHNLKKQMQFFFFEFNVQS